jgi:hypothetical protein
MRINSSMNVAGYAGNTRGRQTDCAIINRGNGRAEVFHTKLHAFLAGLEKTGRKGLAFPPEYLFDGSAMNQFKLIAICLGLASSALGTCTSSMPSL